MAIATTPAFSLITGNYVGPQTLTLDADPSDTDIFYTTDGTEPTHSTGTPTGTTQIYSDPITISTTSVINALGYTTSDTDSPIVSIAVGILPLGVNLTFTSSQVNYLQSVLRQEVQAGYAAQPFTSTDSSDVLDILNVLTGGQ